VYVFVGLQRNISPQYPLSVGYYKEYVEGSINTKFPDLQIDNHLNLENHTEPNIPTLQELPYAVRSLFCFSNGALSKQFVWSIFTL